MTLKIGFIVFKEDTFSMKIYVVVTDVVSDVTYSRKSVNTLVLRSSEHIFYYMKSSTAKVQTTTSYD